MPAFDGSSAEALLRAGETPIHAVDPLVRRSLPLQKSLDGRQAVATMGQAEWSRIGLGDAGGARVSLRQGGGSVTLDAALDDGVPEGSIWVPAGLPETAALGALFGPIEASRAEPLPSGGGAAESVVAAPER